MVVGLVLAGEDGADPHHVHPSSALSAGGSTERSPGASSPRPPSPQGEQGLRRLEGTSWWEQEPPPGDGGDGLATTQREPSLVAKQPQPLTRGEPSRGRWVGRSQPRISGDREQSAAKSLLPGIRHQPPSLQKGPSGGSRCCCSTTLQGPKSQLLPGTTGNGWATQLSAADLKSGHHHGGEGPLMDSTAWLGLAPQVSQPIARGFLAFLAQEHGWLLWGNPGAGVKIRGKGLRDLYLPAISNVPITTTGTAGQSFLSVPSSSPSASRRLCPSPGRRCLHRGWKPVVLGDGGRAFPAWGDPHPAMGLNSPRKRGRKIGKTITRICFMLPGSLPALSSVFGRPIYNQQCGML